MAHLAPMRCDMRVEPFAGSFEGDAGNLGQLVGFLEMFPDSLFQYVNRVLVNPKVGPHSRFQHLMCLAV